MATTVLVPLQDPHCAVKMLNLLMLTNLRIAAPSLKVVGSKKRSGMLGVYLKGWLEGGMVENCCL